MKNFLSFIFIVLLSSQIFSQAGWYQQNSGVNYNLRNYINWNFACIGDGGKILRSSNGGFNWFEQNTGFNENLNCLFQATDLIYFIVGNNGLILRSSNSGANWQQMPSGTNLNLNSIIPGGTGNRLYLFGDNGLMMYSTNSGSNWTLQNIGTSNNLNNAFSYAPVGLIVVGDNGTILKTTDNGLNWININSGTSHNLNHVWISGYSTESLLIVGDNGTILHSTDGGYTWIFKNSGTTLNLNSTFSSYFRTNQALNHFAVGENGLIIRSTDLGNNWFTENSQTTNALYSIKGNYEHMYIVGANGTILNYTLGSGYYSYLFVDANDIKSFHFNDGSFNRRSNPDYYGLEWPKGSGKYAVYFGGLWLGAKLSDSVHVAIFYYDGEFYPGAVNFYNQTPFGKNDPLYRIYKISPVYPNGGDGFDSWSIWPVQQGAKWIDVNNNNVYDPPTDRPVMKGDQNTFCCFTDGYPESHLNYSGSTGPLNSEIHLYTYAAADQQCADIQFMEWEIINKKNQNWDSMIVGIYSDVCVGEYRDDKFGCDSTLNLVYSYNSTNYDEVYGYAPPAIGYVVYDVSRHNRYYADFSNYNIEPENYSEVYNVLKGLKQDGSNWINPVTNKPTKFPYSGDPELGTGWLDNWASDKILLTGSFFGNVVPLDTIKFNAAVIIKRGTNNLNSVTQLKNCINQGVIGLKEQGIVTEIPRRYYLYQNYPNPFNPKTKIKFEVPEETNINFVIYDIQGRVVKTLLNNNLTKAGYHEIEFDGINYASGVYFYKLFNTKFSKTFKMVLMK